MKQIIRLSKASIIHIDEVKLSDRIAVMKQGKFVANIAHNDYFWITVTVETGVNKDKELSELMMLDEFKGCEFYVKNE